MAIQSTVITSGAPQSMLTAAGNIAVTTVYLCNRSSTTVTTNVYIVANGVTNFDNLIYSNLAIASNDTYIMEQERLILSVGDSIRANTDSLSFDSLVATVTFTSI
jgi:hypothetical protein